jgi:prepilin-type N-terminal cleavage/methylation domain-containing protein
MTTTTPSPAKLARATRGFTLVEVLIAAAISAFLLAGVLTSFLFIGRSGQNLANYSDMESEARSGLEVFAQDVRQASAIVWNSATSVSLAVDGASVTYSYNSGTGELSRQGTVLISGITSFELIGYNITGALVSASADLSTAAGRTMAGKITKQLQISLSARKQSVTVATATNTVLSARYTLRNKRVTT